MVILSSFFWWLVSVANYIIVMILSIVGLIIILVVVGIFSLFGDVAWSPITLIKNDVQYEAEFIDRLSNIYGLTIPEGTVTLHFSSYYEQYWDAWEVFDYNLILDSKGIVNEDLMPEGGNIFSGRTVTRDAYHLCDGEELEIENTELRKIICSFRYPVEINYVMKILPNARMQKVLGLEYNRHNIYRGSLIIIFIPDSDFVWIQEEYEQRT